MSKNMSENKTLNVYISEVNSTRATLKVTSKETFWQGDGIKDEDSPGTFLELMVSFERATAPEPYPLEKLAEQYKAVLYRQQKEITHEPEGYAKLFHDHFVKKVQKNPELYTQNISHAVKEAL